MPTTAGCTSAIEDRAGDWTKLTARERVDTRNVIGIPFLLTSIRAFTLDDRAYAVEIDAQLDDAEPRIPRRQLPALIRTNNRRSCRGKTTRRCATASIADEHTHVRSYSSRTTASGVRIGSVQDPFDVFFAWVAACLADRPYL